jgi:hypothetical protein
LHREGTEKTQREREKQRESVGHDLNIQVWVLKFSLGLLFTEQLSLSPMKRYSLHRYAVYFLIVFYVLLV